MRLKVNRYLKDKAMDRVDHALGRPVNPFSETYRNHFATEIDSQEAAEMAASPAWRMGQKIEGGMVYFHVTQWGRSALAEHLERIGGKHRRFTVRWGGYDMPVIATSHSRAKYIKWLDVSDAISDLTFKEFLRTARVRLSPTERTET